MLDGRRETAGWREPGFELELPLPAMAGPIQLRNAATAIAALRDVRDGLPVVLGRVDGGRGLVDLRCVPADRDADVETALRVALAEIGAPEPPFVP